MYVRYIYTFEWLLQKLRRLDGCHHKLVKLSINQSIFKRMILYWYFFKFGIR